MSFVEVAPVILHGAENVSGKRRVGIAGENGDAREGLGRSLEQHVPQPEVDTVGRAVGALYRDGKINDDNEPREGRLVASKMPPAHRLEDCVGG